MAHTSAGPSIDISETEGEVEAELPGVDRWQITLPFAAEPEMAKATFKDGILTIALPKPPEVKAKCGMGSCRRRHNRQG